MKKGKKRNNRFKKLVVYSALLFTSVYMFWCGFKELETTAQIRLSRENNKKESQALDERKEDIPELVEFFTAQICEEQGWAVKHFAPAAIAALQKRHWPGNIRELRNVVERLIILSGPEISANDIDLFA